MEECTCPRQVVAGHGPRVTEPCVARRRCDGEAGRNGSSRSNGERQVQNGLRCLCVEKSEGQSSGKEDPFAELSTLATKRGRGPEGVRTDPTRAWRHRLCRSECLSEGWGQASPRAWGRPPGAGPQSRCAPTRPASHADGWWRFISVVTEPPF